MRTLPVTLDDTLARWERVTGRSRDELDPAYLSFRRAQEELEDVTNDFAGTQYSADPVWQMEFWKDWFGLCRLGSTTVSPEAARICVREINKLRGR